MQLPSLLVLLPAVLYQIGVAQSANILFYAAFGSQSTRISQWPLMEALADRGHNVTYLSPLPQLDQVPGQKSKVYHYVPKKWAEEVGGFVDQMNFYDLRANRKSIDLTIWIDLFEMGLNGCEVLQSDPEYLEWVNSNKFDLVIMDTCNNECVYSAIHLWGSKLALYQTSTVLPFHQDPFGHPDEASSIADMTTVAVNRYDMTFFERFCNELIPILTHLYREYIYLPKIEEIAKKGLGKNLTETLPPFTEIDKNINLVYITSHFSFDAARALPPNVIPIGGNVVAKKPKPLPKDMQDFVDNSPNGFIYVSFGTVTEFTQFDEKVQAEFIKALGQFPDIKFLWKASKPITVAQIPKNVMIAKWVPQQTILAHPKIKGYITHSGMGSTVEAIHFSVPLICVPVLADQDVNAHMTEMRGAGLKVELVDLKAHHLAHAIKEILHNKKYREGMTRLTAIFKDRITPPLETAVWWTEYILRHDNTNEYLLSPSARQPWWKRRNIDIWMFVTVMLLTLITVPLALVYYIAKRVFSTETVNQSQKAKLKKKTN